MNDILTMKAATQNTYGGPEVLEVKDVPRPQPRLNEILVRVTAASLNPTDWRNRVMGGMILGEPPVTLGWDLSGVVEAVGMGVVRFQPGDEVMGMLPYPYGHGAHAEFVAAPARAFVAKPKSLSFIEAAALPLVSLTAWQALDEYANLSAGQRVLIHAAAGGVGHVAVQIAKARGAYVIGTASAPKHEFLRGLGVDETIDYRTEQFDERVSDVDVVLDTLGGDISMRSLHVLKPGGIVVSTAPVGAPEFYTDAKKLGVRGARMLVDTSDSGLAAITELVQSGSLRPTIAETFPLSRIADAHRAGEMGHTTGKIVITME